MVFFRIGISYREFDPWMKNIESNVLSCERSQVVRHVYKAFETGNSLERMISIMEEDMLEGTDESHWNSRMHAYGPLYARNPAIGWIRCFQPGVRREESTIQPRPFDAEFPSIFISATCLSQKFIIIRSRVGEIHPLPCMRVHVDNNEHVCHTLLVISSAAINIPLFI